jgi:hypothetical protein
VANADSGPVTAYLAKSSGAVAPARRVNNPQDPNTMWAPWGVTFDIAGNLYVQTFLSDATTFVFPRGAGETTRPDRIFRVNGPDSRAIAVDAVGNSYIPNGQFGAVISVAAPCANGAPANLYTVPELRQIPTDESGFSPWPDTVTVGPGAQVIAAVPRSTGNALEIFTGGSGGGSAPTRVISGPHTGLGACSTYDLCDRVSVTYSPFTGRIYAAVSQGAQTHISVFAGDASGDATPVRTIAGGATGLAGKVITGVAGSQVDGTIYVMLKPTQFSGPAVVAAFDRLASGNAAPRRTFTDSTSSFQSAQGIAITSG